MSIALLHQIFDETRRLAVAGSATAPGDFRLKKLIEPLKQAGVKAPVFAKLADSANAVISANEQTAPDALLNLLGLATAIRYTQGETGLAGTLEPLGARIPLARPIEVSARTLQPLYESLGRNGGGRHEVILEAHQKGVFKDVRLVQRAIAGLDDSYSEIAELFAKKIIPESYGPGIAPLVKAGYDPKGNKGSARRLQLLHKFDPAGTRELVMQVLEDGSKEVRVAALSCLGLHSDDVHILIEQTSAKAQDVRTAAYYGLSQMDVEEAVNALVKVMTGKELAHAWRPLSDSKGPRLLKAILAEFRKELAELFTLKDKKEISSKIERLGYFLHTLKDRSDKDSEAMVLELFGLRDKLAKVKGDTLSGSDLNLDVVRAMSGGTKAMAMKLATAHQELQGDAFRCAFDSGGRQFSAEQFFDAFSPYLRPFSKHDKQIEDKKQTILALLTAPNLRRRTYGDTTDISGLDPRWLNIGLEFGHIELIELLGQPGDAKIAAYLSKEFDAIVKNRDGDNRLRAIVCAMVRINHPDGIEAFFTGVQRFKSKDDFTLSFQYGELIPFLPKVALQRLEEHLVKLSGYNAKTWLNRIEELRAKPDPV